MLLHTLELLCCTDLWNSGCGCAFDKGELEGLLSLPAGLAHPINFPEVTRKQFGMSFRFHGHETEVIQSRPCSKSYLVGVCGSL